jgi:hypothetical protein
MGTPPRILVREQVSGVATSAPCAARPPAGPSPSAAPRPPRSQGNWLSVRGSSQAVETARGKPCCLEMLVAPVPGRLLTSRAGPGGAFVQSTLVPRAAAITFCRRLCRRERAELQEGIRRAPSKTCPGQPRWIRENRGDKRTYGLRAVERGLAADEQALLAVGRLERGEGGAKEAAGEGGGDQLPERQAAKAQAGADTLELGRAALEVDSGRRSRAGPVSAVVGRLSLSRKEQRTEACLSESLPSLLMISMDMVKEEMGCRWAFVGGRQVELMTAAVSPAGCAQPSSSLLVVCLSSSPVSEPPAVPSPLYRQIRTHPP